ncbi:DUF599 family protein [Marinomonas agarivorans]|nr:DUF599 family protein [Marinomonas agarivorans]
MPTDSYSLFTDVIGLITLLFFFASWFGYSLYAHYQSKRRDCLVSIMHQLRLAWMLRLLKRDNRIGDVSIMANLERSSLFFASSSLLIVAGLFTAFNYSEKALGIISEFYLLAPSSRQEWELKVVILIVIFAYAFFTFTWSVRQYNFGSVLVGSAPMATERGFTEEERDAYAIHMAEVCSLAANQFNYGLRAYYFAMAFSGWFLGPHFCIISALIVIYILYRREFRSKTFKALKRGRLASGEHVT